MSKKSGPPLLSQNAVRHGGAGAVKRIRQGKELIGIARQQELAVYQELEEDGLLALVVRNAARLQAACDCYWTALVTAAAGGDLELVHGYVKTFGWLAQAALRAWRQVEGTLPDGGDVVDYEELLASEREE